MINLPHISHINGMIWERIGINAYQVFNPDNYDQRAIYPIDQNEFDQSFTEIIQSKEGNGKMTIMQKLAAMKSGNGAVNNPVINTNAGLTLQERLKAQNALQAKKSIITQSTELSVEKFARIESLEKKVDYISKDISAITNAIKTMQDSILQQEPLLINLAKEQNALRLLIESMKVKQVAPTQSAPVQLIKQSAPTQSAPVQSTETGNEIEQWYKLFSKSFSPFNGSKEVDQIDTFIALVSSINWNGTPDTIDKEIRSAWASRKKEVKPSGMPATYCGAPQLGTMVQCLIESYNKVNNAPVIEQPKSKPIIDTNYWIKHFNGNGPMVTDCINAAKTVDTIDNDFIALITDYVIETVGEYEQSALDQFIAWLRPFTKGKK